MNLLFCFSFHSATFLHFHFFKEILLSFSFFFFFFFTPKKFRSCHLNIFFSSTALTRFLLNWQKRRNTSTSDDYLDGEIGTNEIKKNKKGKILQTHSHMLTLSSQAHDIYKWMVVFYRIHFHVFYANIYIC